MSSSFVASTTSLLDLIYGIYIVNSRTQTGHKLDEYVFLYLPFWSKSLCWSAFCLRQTCGERSSTSNFRANAASVRIGWWRLLYFAADVHFASQKQKIQLLLPHLFGGGDLALSPLLTVFVALSCLLFVATAVAEFYSFLYICENSFK